MPKQKVCRATTGMSTSCPWSRAAPSADAEPFCQHRLPCSAPRDAGEEAAALGFSTPDEDLDTRIRAQISGRGIGHSDHVGSSTPGTPHGSHPSPSPNMTLAEKSVQGRLAELCLCPSHRREGEVLFATFLPRPGRGTVVSLLCLP